MSKRAHNFNAGPAALPLSILEKAQSEFLDFGGAGMSILEMSHRSKEYEGVHNKAAALLKELLAIPDNYDVLFLQGGASLQFAMVPMNFLPAGKKAEYILTGVWAEKAWEEAKKLGDATVAASTKEENHCRIPSLAEISWSPETAYLHLTSNNTIFGTQWSEFPDTGAVPLIADMSSDILCKPVDVSKFALIYAGAQKNLGPAGVTIVILRRDMMEKANSHLPTMLRYSTFAKDNSLYNTPPVFSIYMVSLMLDWIKQQGGVAAMEQKNRDKASLIYDTIDNSGGFYTAHAKPGSRSLMNIAFRLKNGELEKKFLETAKKSGFVGLAGHRLVGGCRASVYNAVPRESCEALQDLMVKFQKEN